MDPLYILVLATIVIMSWFAFGVLYNLRRGDKLLRWIRGGLPRIGERTTFRWLGTSVVEMVIAKARRPFRRLETMIVLTPWDIPWMRLAALFQGRNDTLIFRAQLPSAPAVELEYGDPKSWTGRMGLKDATRSDWQSQPQGEMTLAAPSGRLNRANEILAALSETMGRLSPHYFRFTLRKEGSHFEIHIPFPKYHQLNADEWFGKLQDLARAVTETGRGEASD